ncbi:M23 family metallopeptidase [Pseudovibrio sp. Tun.PSC04-5.I4]|uniref:M23 family metallopeptidase n=1 Tax=Pseudovibrio sp. Tun.PSC04-5.I4 TaxID=1798213 RepID=UPI00088B8155|nr:M23 family metallopeptidase [Pseudovibrio sp. Tun.PSC04-5.I4]SDR09102.1 Murein DD-endopeptidase MepM and murein hydrolase activator NlpD, contain LysM domain [Pseudovibrio sp. Tun.PSC04-5.I4]
MWFTRAKSELRAMPSLVYWISGIAATAVISALLASNFQQSLHELRQNSKISREIALRENYESEIRDLKFQLGELRGRQDLDATGYESASLQKQKLTRQFQEVEALVALAQRSNLILSVIPPSPKRKPSENPALEQLVAALSYAPQQGQSNTINILGTLSGQQRTKQDYALTTTSTLSTRQQQGQRLLTAYTQAALQDIKRANTLLNKIGVAQSALNFQRNFAGGAYQELPISDLDSSMMLARRIIEQRIELGAIVNALPFARPLDSFLPSSSFGPRTDPFLDKPAMHTGLDFRAPRGAPVRATGSGIVLLAKYNGGYGLSVEILHENGLVTRYAHMQKLLVSEGQRIRSGNMVGTVGNTGRSTGPHLHYEVRLNGKPVNPMRYIRTGDRLAAIFQPKQNTTLALKLP